MESFFVRYRNLLVLLALLAAQILGLALQIRRTGTGQASFGQHDDKGQQLIRLWANAVVSPPERAVQSSKTGVGWIWENYFDLRRVRQENKDLQAEIDQLRLEQAQLLEDAKQGQRLQTLNSFQQKYIYKTLSAEVIGGSGTDLSRVFYLNKGKDDGLTRDMAVITPDGIVGKVREVYPHSAQVLAINDQSSGAGVILETTRIRGILRGNAAGQPAVVNILADQRIKPGEKVLTSGGDQIFPRGLPVGTVDHIDKDPDRDGFVEVVVKPAANLNGLDEVMVITDTEPRFNDKTKKDMDQSASEKGAEAAALNEQLKAAQILEEKLPGLTDPNAKQPAANGTAPATGAATANGATPATPPAAPKLLTPQHPDRFSTGYSSQSSSAPKTTAPKPATSKTGADTTGTGATPGTTSKPPVHKPATVNPGDIKIPPVPKSDTNLESPPPAPAKPAPQPQRKF